MSSSCQCHRVFVGDVPLTATADELSAAFERLGIHVVRVELVVDRVTGVRRHFAFVELDVRDEVRGDPDMVDSVTLDGHVLPIQRVPPPRRRAA